MRTMNLTQAIAVLAACAYTKDAEGLIDAWEVVKSYALSDKTQSNSGKDWFINRLMHDDEAFSKTYDLAEAVSAFCGMMPGLAGGKEFDAMIRAVDVMWGAE